MKVLIFGATGMVGQGVLRECLLDPKIEFVQTIGRNITGEKHAKLRELVHKDLYDYSSIEDQLTGFDACFFCLGITSFRMKEEDYERITYTLTMAAARTLAGLNPGMTFVYVSGLGTDSSEGGRTMWARVKGKTENAIMRLPFKASYMFRPGAIIPLEGIRSKTFVYRLIYGFSKPIWRVLRWAFPSQVTTTEEIGRAMIGVARFGFAKRIVENGDFGAIVVAELGTG